MWRHSTVVSAYEYRHATIRNIIWIPVKITVQIRVLSADCQLSYRKFYGFFTVYFVLILLCCILMSVLKGFKRVALQLMTLSK